ncbi:MAG: response regulator transcription factor [Proteobacteria bacterium]|nr:response regulator transcription factor [Pseudomonadota bacterium]MBU1584256.1 response regulator transcription factor [Pseudomonadota bacterium]MBU2455504.1 response regulator transcription factor [Pseudomonadota bacterium]MBU2629396.1 response regulator transcription factor [Pseudomonadota bacterium]
MIPEKSKIKIMIVEDHPIFRMGMTEMINREKDMTVCGDAEDVAGALNSIEKEMPDIIVVDLSLKNSNGIDLVKEVSEKYKAISCLVLSMHDESLHAERCIMAGAKGYIMKQEASISVVKAIREILSGNLYVSNTIMSHILTKFRHQPAALHESPLKHLTDREMEIFQFIGRGYASGEIAKRLNISVKTIGTYRERIKAKLNINHSGRLVRQAVIWVETGVFKPSV